jgi:hypothetical protein
MLDVADSLMPSSKTEPIDDLTAYLTAPGERGDLTPAPRLLRVLTDGATTTGHLIGEPGAAAGPGCPRRTCRPR